MDLIDAVKTRKSIRGFKPDPVSQEIIKEVLSIAHRAPSGSNIQPWEFAVITGDVLENIKRGNIEMFRSGEPPRQERQAAEKPADTIYQRRRVELSKQLFALMAIEREDAAKRAAWREKGIRFFDAPAAIIVLNDRLLPKPGPLLDMGIVIQTVCLAAMNYGLGTCIEGQATQYPDVLRKYANIPDSKRIVIAIAIGYPDWDDPANRVESAREPIDNITTWHGFR
jgi:nitroreductase